MSKTHMDKETGKCVFRGDTFEKEDDETDRLLGECLRKFGKLEISWNQYGYSVLNGGGHLRIDLMGHGQTLNEAVKRAINMQDVFQ